MSRAITYQPAPGKTASLASLTDFVARTDALDDDGNPLVDGVFVGAVSIGSPDTITAWLLTDAEAVSSVDALAEPYAVGKDYAAGDVVSWQGASWVVRQAHMSQADWPPDTTLALYQRVGPAPGQVTEWATNTPYAVGDHVTYLGVEYVCIQAHTSQAGWTPPVVPALWSLAT